MKKLLTIIKREYLTRVNSKAFIFSTILGPIVMVAFMVVPVFIAMMETGAADATGRRGSDGKTLRSRARLHY